MKAVDQVLKTITQLTPGEQVELAARLLARLEEAGLWPARPAGDDAPVDLVLLFDGGSLGNPGPGYGSFVLSFRDGREVYHRLDFGPSMTNNEAEYSTLIAGLEEGHRLLGQDVGGAFLEVRGDSRLVARQVRGQWKAREPRMQALRQRALALLRPFRAWRFVEIPREEAVRRLGH